MVERNPSAVPAASVHAKEGSVVLHRAFFLIGAGDGIRTRDLHLGKVPLYQLSHSRSTSESVP